jgi:hypothetical protein
LRPGREKGTITCELLALKTNIAIDCQRTTNG